MNETLKTISQRRSCRKFLDKEVSQEVINAVLDAGATAPSAMNQNSGSIMYLKNAEIVETLRNNLIEFVGRDPFYGAKNIIIVFAKNESMCPIQDGSCILENMFIAATSLGLGSCWINCLHDYFATVEGNQFKKQKLGLDDDDITIGACIIGYPDPSYESGRDIKKSLIRVI